jgi:transcriptional regulator with XRE-family HTH domain
MGNNLKTLRELRGWTHDEAAAQMGMSRGGFIKLERGERRLNERTIAQAARAFGVQPEEVINDRVQKIPTGDAAPLGKRDLPVFSAAEGAPGEMVVSTDPIELVQRPWYLKDVRDGFAVLIVGESMVPVFEPGDLAVINPRLPPMRNKDTIFIADEVGDQFTATIKRLINWNEREWHVRQFNAPHGQKAELVLPRKTWRRALRVVGKFYGGG